MAWRILVLAGLFEVGWAIGLKCSLGFTRLAPSVWTILAMAISFALLGLAVKAVPLGIVLFGESADVARMNE